MSNEIILNSDNFDTVILESKIPVIIDFWASWCGPCQMLMPIIEEIANENIGKIKVCKVNVDEEENLARKFNISSIPTLMFFKDGKNINRTVGFQPKEAILSFI